jgi:transposase-like protein
MDTKRKTSYSDTINSNYEKTIQKTQPETNKKWVSFTYTGHYIWKITKLFKDINIKIAYRTTSTLDKLLNEKQKTNPYEQSGIYKLTCQSCHKMYIDQTGRKLTRYKEHIRSTHFNKDESAFAQHIK